MKPEVREMAIGYFVKVPEIERQVRDKIHQVHQRSRISRITIRRGND